MRRVGQTRKRDANEAEIVQTLRKWGAEVWRISGVGLPDLLIRYRGKLFAAEVKTSSGKRTKAQEKTQWPIIRCNEDAIVLIGRSYL